MDKNIENKLFTSEMDDYEKLVNDMYSGTADPYFLETLKGYPFIVWWIYVESITYVNKMLEQNTLSRAKAIKEPASYHVSSAVKENYHNLPKRRVRSIPNAGVSIISEKAPKAPCEAYVRHYSVAQWSVRGFVRHLGSGKTVYIKPQVRRRHSLNTQNELIPSTLKIKG